MTDNDTAADYTAADYTPIDWTDEAAAAAALAASPYLPAHDPAGLLRRCPAWRPSKRDRHHDSDRHHDEQRAPIIDAQAASRARAMALLHAAARASGKRIPDTVVEVRKVPPPPASAQTMGPTASHASAPAPADDLLATLLPIERNILRALTGTAKCCTELAELFGRKRNAVEKAVSRLCEWGFVKRLDRPTGLRRRTMNKGPAGHEWTACGPGDPAPRPPAANRPGPKPPEMQRQSQRDRPAPEGRPSVRIDAVRAAFAAGAVFSAAEAARKLQISKSSAHDAFTRLRAEQYIVRANAGDHEQVYKLAPVVNEVKNEERIAA